MTQEIQGTDRQEVEAFVQQIREFHESLTPARRKTLEGILDAAQASDTTGFGRRAPAQTGEEQQAEEAGNSSSYSYDDGGEGWGKLTEWLD